MYVAELNFFSITSTHIFSTKGKTSFNVRFESSASCMILMAPCIHTILKAIAWREGRLIDTKAWVKVLSTEGLTMQRVHFSSWLEIMSNLTLSDFSRGRVATGKSIEPNKTAMTPLHRFIFMLAQHKKKGGVVVQGYVHAGDHPLPLLSMIILELDHTSSCTWKCCLRLWKLW